VLSRETACPGFIPSLGAAKEGIHGGPWASYSVLGLLPLQRLHSPMVSYCQPIRLAVSSQNLITEKAHNSGPGACFILPTFSNVVLMTIPPTE
jgi:hypothetical protein